MEDLTLYRTGIMGGMEAKLGVMTEPNHGHGMSRARNDIIIIDCTVHRHRDNVSTGQLVEPRYNKGISRCP